MSLKLVARRVPGVWESSPVVSTVSGVVRVTFRRRSMYMYIGAPSLPRSSPGSGRPFPAATLHKTCESASKTTKSPTQ